MRNAYGAPITMPSSPLMMPESPLVMHHDAQNGQCKLYTIYTVIDVCSLDDGLIPPCGCTSSHRSRKNAVSQELHLPGMDIWEHVLLVQISAQMSVYSGGRDQTSPYALAGVALSAILAITFEALVTLISGLWRQMAVVM